jgi:hypothetical protein
MNIIKVKDYDSMQAITVSLAKNGYLVTADSVADEHYKEHWEIKYCEFSEITEKSINNNFNDFDGDYLGSMEIHNEENTKGVKCKILQDNEVITPEECLNPIQKLNPDLYEKMKKWSTVDNKDNTKCVKSEIVPDEKSTNVNQNITMGINYDERTDEQSTVITSVSSGN